MIGDYEAWVDNGEMLDEHALDRPDWTGPADTVHEAVERAAAGLYGDGAGVKTTDELKELIVRRRQGDEFYQATIEVRLACSSVKPVARHLLVEDGE